MTGQNFVKKRSILDALKDKLARLKGEVYVNHTCNCCGAHYLSWRISEIDAIDEMGIWYTCKKTLKEAEEMCGSTLLFLSKEQRAKLNSRKRAS